MTADPLGGLLGGTEEEETRGVPRDTCDPDMLEKIPEDMEKIHCEISSEKIKEEILEAVWPKILPEFSDFEDLFKNFNIEGITNFVTKLTTHIPKAIASLATDAAGDAAGALGLGGPSYEDIEPVCLDSILGRFPKCQCNEENLEELVTSGSAEEFAIEIARKAPPMLLMPVVDAGIMKFMVETFDTFMDDDKSIEEIDSFKIQIIWAFLKFKEYIGYFKDSVVPVPCIFSEKEKEAAEASHYHWYNMTVIDAYMEKADVSVSQYDFIDKFMQFDEIKDQLEGTINQLLERKIWDDEVFNPIMDSINDIFDGIEAMGIPIKEEIPIDIEQIKGMVSPAPTIGDIFDKLGISPPTMTDGAAFGLGVKAGVEAAALEGTKYFLHEFIFARPFNKDPSDSVEVICSFSGVGLGFVLFAITASVPYNTVVGKSLRTLVSMFTILFAVTKFIWEAVKLFSDTDRNIAEWIMEIIIGVLEFFETIRIIVYNIYQIATYWNPKWLPKPKEGTEASRGKNIAEHTAKYIFYDILGLETVSIFFQMAFVTWWRNKTKEDRIEGYKELLQSMPLPLISEMYNPFTNKTMGQGIWSSTFIQIFRTLFDFIIIEIIKEWFLRGFFSGKLPDFARIGQNFAAFGAPARKLTITGGKGGGDYPVGWSVTITADPPPAGKVFNEWTGDANNFNDTQLYSSTTTFPMQDKDCTITATYKDITYTLTVTGGTGGGEYPNAASASISADPPVEGKEFDAWTGADVSTVANVNASSTTLTMLAKALTITATYKDKIFNLTVEGGTGAGPYKMNQSVPVEAEEPEEGKEFENWTGDTDGLADAASSSTTLTMPAQDVTITAGYKDKMFQLTVTKGTGTGQYTMGQDVTIEAEMDDINKEFDKWTGDVELLDDVKSPVMNFNMPAKDITITATFKNIK